jgi:hypothetical protein
MMWDNVLWAVAGTAGMSHISVQSLQCQVYKLVNSDTCPRPTTGILCGSALLESALLGRRRTLALGLAGCALSYLAFALAETNAQIVAVSLG